MSKKRSGSIPEQAITAGCLKLLVAVLTIPEKARVTIRPGHNVIAMLAQVPLQ